MTNDENATVAVQGRAVNTNIPVVRVKEMIENAGSFELQQGANLSIRIQGDWENVLPVAKIISALMDKLCEKDPMLSVRTAGHYNHLDKKTRDALDTSSGRIYYSLYRRKKLRYKRGSPHEPTAEAGSE